MVKLSRDTELGDCLNVLAANARELELTLTTERPLRKPKTMLQTKQLVDLRRDITSQIFDQLSTRARRSFRGPIAVEFRLGLPSGRHGAQLTTAVKAYLDALKGPVVFDDATVEHLLVVRGAPPINGAEVRVRCLPTRLFAADYDRAFRVLPEYEDVTAAPESIPDPAAPWTTPEPWGYRHFGRDAMDRLKHAEGQLRYLESLDAEEAYQLTEDPDADVELDLSYDDEGLADWEVRTSLRMHLEKVIADAHGDWLTDQGLDARDRPGPAPSWLDETRALDAAEVLELGDEGPGCIVVLAPWRHNMGPGQPNWTTLVERGFLEARSRSQSRRPPTFRGPVALDIALRGGAARHRDVDNIARDVLRAFNRAFEASHPHVYAYRVYRQTWPEADVRIRIMPAVRLAVLAGAMDRARRVARGDRAQRTRE